MHAYTPESQMDPTYSSDPYSSQKGESGRIFRIDLRGSFSITVILLPADPKAEIEFGTHTSRQNLDLSCSFTLLSPAAFVPQNFLQLSDQRLPSQATLSGIFLSPAQRIFSAFVRHGLPETSSSSYIFSFTNFNSTTSVLPAPLLNHPNIMESS